MPVIPQYQPSQSLNPQSGARFRAPDTPDLIGPALQQAAAQLKAAATEAEKRQAAEAESEANRRMAKYEYGVTGIMYGRPGEAGTAPTVGYTTLNGQQALDAEPEVRQALADLNTSVFDGASTEVADLLRPAISTASTRYERSLAAHGNAQAEVARVASLSARTSASTAAAVGAVYQPDEFAAAVASVGAAADAEAAAKGYDAQTAEVHRGATVGTAVRQAVARLINEDTPASIARAQALVTEYEPQLRLLGLPGEEVINAVGDRVETVAARTAANTDFAALPRNPDGSLDNGALQTQIQAYRDAGHTEQEAAAYTNYMNGLGRADEARRANADAQLVQRGWALASTPDGDLNSLTADERLRIGPTLFASMLAFQAGDAEGKPGREAYFLLDQMADTDPVGFARAMRQQEEPLPAMSVEDLSRLLKRAREIDDPKTRRTAITAADAEIWQALRPELVIDGVTPQGKTADNYAAAQLASRRVLTELAEMNPPGWVPNENDKLKARNAALAATGDREAIARMRQSQMSDTVRGARAVWRVAGVTLTDGLRARSIEAMRQTGGAVVIAWQDIPLQDRKDLRDKLIRRGIAEPSVPEMEAEYTTIMLARIRAERQ